MSAKQELDSLQGDVVPAIPGTWQLSKTTKPIVHDSVSLVPLVSLFVEPLNHELAHQVNLKNASRLWANEPKTIPLFTDQELSMQSVLLATMRACPRSRETID